MGPLRCVPVRPQLRFVLAAVSAALAIALVVAIVLGGSPGGSSSRSTTPNGSRDGGFDGAAFPVGVRAHDFTLTDQYGRSVSLSAYRGQVVVLALLPASALQGVPSRVSTDCRACVLVAQQVRGALDELESHPPAKPGVRVVFVSATSRANARARVGRLLEETSLSGRVEYLTGTPTDLRPVWRAYGVTPASGGRSASEAATTVLLIDRTGAERVAFGLEQITPEGLAHDIRLLKAG